MAIRTIDPKFYKPQDQQPAAGIGETFLKLEYDDTNGDLILKQYSIIGGVKGKEFEVYKNGTWNYIPGAVTSIPEKREVNSSVKKTAIEKLSTDKRNIIPAFVTQDAQSQDVGASGKPVPSENSAGIAGKIGELFGEFPISLDDYGTPFLEMKKIFPKPLKYPLDIIDSQQDILKITQYTYTAPYGDVFKGKQNDKIFDGNNSLGVQRKTALKEPIQTLILPIPNNVADSNGVNWGSGDEMSAMNMAAAGNVGKVALALGGKELAGKLSGAIGLTGVQSILNTPQASKAAGMLAVGGLNNPATNAAIQSLILKRGGFEISPETILSRGYGVVANSNLELLFSGPILRGFQFSYVLSPRSETEAKMCRNIIRYFKQGMAAKKKRSTGYGAASFFLGTPNVFKLEYKSFDSKTKEQINIEGLNKFKICALTGMNVTYADGQWSAFEKGQPVRMQLSLNFKELEPIYESDYQKDPYIEGYEDQPSVGPDDVGF